MRQNGTENKLLERIRLNLSKSFSFQNIHGSSEACFENIAFAIGFRPEPENPDYQAFYDYYLRRFIEGDELLRSDFMSLIIYDLLLYVGRSLGRRDEALYEAFAARLDRVCQFIDSGDRIFYSDEEKSAFRGIPPQWREQKLVRRENTSPYLRLPYMYDLPAYSALYGEDAATDRKIDRVLRYVLSEAYQEEVKNGYGIGINGERGFVKSSYYSVGWDVGVNRLTTRQELMYLRLLSSVDAVRDSDWYRSAVADYRAAAGEASSPLLTSAAAVARNTYWTSGCYLYEGLGKKERLAAFIKLIGELPLE